MRNHFTLFVATLLVICNTIHAEDPEYSQYEIKTWSTTTHDKIVDGLIETTVTDSLGNTTKTYTDGAGRVRKTIDAAGNISTAKFDPKGNLVESRDALGHGQNCTYDALNRRVSCADTQELAENKARLTSYNASGAVLTQTDTKGAVIVNSYDIRERLVSITERNTGMVQFAYDAKGQRTSVIDQIGKITSYQFTPRGELFKTFWADGSVETVVFDALGRQAKKTRQDDSDIVWNYDMASRLLTREYHNPDHSLESVDSFTYDNASRPLTAVKGRYNVTTSFVYDAIGRQVNETTNGLGVSTSYDSANRVVELNENGRITSRSYTNRNQLAAVTHDGQIAAQFSYDVAGREISRSFGNGLNENRSYSRADNLVTAITVVNQPELSFGYNYDSNKNVSAEQRGGSMALYSWNATFDNMDRLNSQNDSIQQRSWSLDLVGSTTAETLDGTSTARTLNDTHAPLAAGTAVYTYDARGNMTSKSGLNLLWDLDDHLKQSTSTGPTPTVVDYAYDAFGNRIQKGDTRYVLKGNQVLAEYANNQRVRSYAYGDYIDDALVQKDASPLYFHRNRQFNTVAMTDAVGAIVEQYTIDAMGRVKTFDAASSAKIAPTATTVLFSGRVWDDETGLYYFRARYFEPQLGVFISRDSLGFVDGQSVYQGWFIYNFLNDYSGHCTFGATRDGGGTFKCYRYRPSTDQWGRVTWWWVEGIKSCKWPEICNCRGEWVHWWLSETCECSLDL